MSGTIGQLMEPFGAVHSAVEDIKNSAGSIGDIFSGDIGIIDGLSGAFSGVVSSAENISGALSGFSEIKGTFTDLQEMLSVTGADFSDLGGLMSSIPKPNFSAILPLLSTLGTGAMAAAASVWALIAPFLAIALPIIAVVAGVALLMNHLGIFSDISKVFSGDMSLGEFFITLKDKLFGFVSGIIEAVPQIIENGKNLIIGFIKGLSEKIPEVIQSGIEMLTNFVSTIISAVPGLIQAGITLLTNFISGLVTIIPTILATALSLMVGFVAMIISAIPNLIAAGIQILIALIGGITSMIGNLLKIGGDFISTIISGIATVIGQLKDKGAEIFNKLKDGIVEKMAGMLDIGKNIIQGLIDGVGAMKNAVVNKIKEIGNSMLDGIKGLFGIKSPSRVMKGIGGYMSIGLANGIESESDKVKRATDHLAEAAMIDPKDLKMKMSDMRSLSKPLSFSNMIDTQGLEASNSNRKMISNQQTIQFNQPIARPSELLRKMRQANQEMGWNM
ncbi:putative membrane protein [Carnobacterium maltaromaticum]|nr:putative membrane protein [Carnobacterium maltaromaticum]